MLALFFCQLLVNRFAAQVTPCYTCECIMSAINQPSPIVNPPPLELDPIDWQQMELLARISPAQRLLAMMDATEFALAGLRGAFHRRYPDLSPAEINMRVLAYVTPVRGIIENTASPTTTASPPQSSPSHF